MRPVGDSVTYCLRLLKTRLRSRHELNQAMQRRGIEEPIRMDTLQTLEELKFVDDLHFAGAWVRTRDKLAPRGESILRLELLQKGIAKETIAKVLEERRIPTEGQPSEAEMAAELLRRRDRQFAHLDPAVRQRRQIALLQRRGFSFGTIKRILDV